jgi:tetratricopeptide (TPR) repeat protein
LQQGKAHEAREQLSRADRLRPQMPEVLYSLGKASFLDSDQVAAEKAWLELLSLEKNSDLAAQTHFELAALYRRQGKAEAAQQEMKEFQKLQNISPSQTTQAPQQ